MLRKAGGIVFLENELFFVAGNRLLELENSLKGNEFLGHPYLLDIRQLPAFANSLILELLFSIGGRNIAYSGPGPGCCLS